MRSINPMDLLARKGGYDRWNRWSTTFVGSGIRVEGLYWRIAVEATTSTKLKMNMKNRASRDRDVDGNNDDDDSGEWEFEY